MWTVDPSKIITAEQKAAAAAAAALRAFEDALQAHVDDTARERTFRDGVTLASYVASTNQQWAAEAQAFVAWRDGVWAYSYEVLDNVLSGEMPQPSIEEFIEQLPPISWPD